MKTTQWCHAGTKAILYYFVALNGSDLIVYRREGEEGGRKGDSCVALSRPDTEILIVWSIPWARIGSDKAPLFTVTLLV